MTDNITTPITASTKFKTKDTGANGHLPGHVLYDSAEAEALGLVTPNPAAYSLLGRLKALASYSYEALAASGSAVMGGAGAAGDYLDSVLIIPATTSPGAVKIYDGSTSPDQGVTIFAGGTVADIKSFSLPIRAVSVSGAWTITTGANVSVLASGRFT